MCQRARAVKRQHDVVFMISAPDRLCKLLAGPAKPRGPCRSLVATPVAAYRSSARAWHTEGHRLPRARGAMDHRLQATSLNLPPIAARQFFGAPAQIERLVQFPSGHVVSWGYQSGAKSPHSKGWALAALGPSRPAPESCDTCERVFQRCVLPQHAHTLMPLHSKRRSIFAHSCQFAESRGRAPCVLSCLQRLTGPRK